MAEPKKAKKAKDRKVTVLVANNIQEQPNLVAVCRTKRELDAALRKFIDDVTVGLRCHDNDDETASEMDDLASEGKLMEAIEVWEESQDDECLHVWKEEGK